MEASRRKERVNTSQAGRSRGFWSQYGQRAGPLVALFFKPKPARQINSDPCTWDAELADKLWSDDKSANMAIIGELINGLGDANLLAVQRAVELLMRVRRSEKDGRG
jgi:hypothetical protein